MHRFFIPVEYFQAKEISLPANVSQQISRVLRLKTGIEIILLDGTGLECTAQLCEISDTHCTALVKSKQPSEGEPAVRLTLLVGITQREKFELILQKCTEIGVSTILPVITSRTLVQKAVDVEDKYPRWKKIIQEAAEQSHRGRLPHLLPIMKYTEAVSFIKSDDALKLVLWEDESETGIKQILHQYHEKQVVVLVGPEGGLSTEEVGLAQANKFIPVSLGKRILRMETAAMMATGLVIYEFG